MVPGPSMHCLKMTNFTVKQHKYCRAMSSSPSINLWKIDPEHDGLEMKESFHDEKRVSVLKSI